MIDHLKSSLKLAAVAIGLGLLGAVIGAASAGADTVVFNFTTPGPYEVAIPQYTTQLQAVVNGANGNDGGGDTSNDAPGGPGGAGAQVSATEPVGEGFFFAGNNLVVQVGASGDGGQGGSGNELGGSGGNGGGASVVTDVTDGDAMVAGAAGGGGGGGGGAVAGYDGGGGGQSGPGGPGAGAGNGSGGVRGASGCDGVSAGNDGGSAGGGTDAGGGGGGGAGVCGGSGGGAGGAGGGGGGGGGSGDSFYNPDGISGTGSFGLNPGASGSVQITFTRTPVAPQITSGSSLTVPLSSGGVPFHVSATGFPTPDLSLSGQPPWVSLDSSTGTLFQDIPSNIRGTFSFTIGATDGVAPDAAQTFTLNVTAPGPSVTAPGALQGNVTNPFFHQFNASGGILPLKWTSSGALPAGVTLGTNGALAGTPTKTGTSKFTVSATDSGTPSHALGTARVTMTVAPRTLTITTLSLPTAQVGTPYTQTLSAIMAIKPVNWRISSGALPKGLSLSASTGKITGTPSQSGLTSFSVAATDATTPTAMTATAKLRIAVKANVQAAEYVVQGGYSGLLSFGLGANGNVAPLTNLSGAATGLNGTAAVTIDLNGRLYVANDGSDEITEYPYGTTGNVAPSSLIAGSRTGLADPSALAIGGDGSLYVANYPAGTITVYPPGAQGNVAPTATLGGADTGLSGPEGLAFGPGGDLWVANLGNNSLTAYSPRANGDAKPAVTIAGGLTGLNQPQAMTLDAAGNLLVANSFGDSLTEYPVGDRGNAAPLRTISGPATGLSIPDGVDIDAVGNIYVSNQLGLTEYAPTATGNAAPLATVSGATTGLSAPGKVAVAPPLSVATQRLTRARAGRRYFDQLYAFLGSTPYHWKKIHGRLPKGIHLSRTGRLRGTPKHRGVYRFTVRATDSTRPRMTATARLVLRVRKR